MAKINISGTIDKVFPSGVGFSVVETQTNKTTGVEYKNWFNIFTKEIDGHNVGDSVSVEGLATAGAFMGKDKDGQPAPKGSISVNLVTVTKQAASVAPPVEDDIF
mgnify:CR=1 FL=1|jgi:hypothetical protein|tara:strand:+ start:679 stop:993 length:315 start_codon:yes stop_codon:yes gene_type:complete